MINLWLAKSLIHSVETLELWIADLGRYAKKVNWRQKDLPFFYKFIHHYKALTGLFWSTKESHITTLTHKFTLAWSSIFLPNYNVLPYFVFLVCCFYATEKQHMKQNMLQKKTKTFWKFVFFLWWNEDQWDTFVAFQMTTKIVQKKIVLMWSLLDKSKVITLTE